jgi:steroid delta-isomerase-like uncharacterized protein
MEGLTRADLQSTVDRYLDAWHRRDVDALLAFHAPDGILESPMYGTRRGLAEIEEAHRAFFRSFPDMKMSVQAIIIDPPHAAIFHDAAATHVHEFFGLPGTNRQFGMRVARSLEFDGNGLIARERRIYDFTGILLQLGVLRAKPAKPKV